ncbi:hypothetical protein AAG906_010477 [Vitis piasezkii]
MAETTKLCILALEPSRNLSSKELKGLLFKNRLSRDFRHSKGQNHFATKGYSRRAAKLASILRFSASNLSHISGNFRRKSTTLQKAAKSLNKRVISQHFAKCFLQLRVIDLKCIHQLDFRKCSKSGCHDCHQEYASWRFSLLFSLHSDQLLEKGFKALVLHVSELPIALPKIPKNSPQSWIALVIKLLTKHQNLHKRYGRMTSQPNAKAEMYILKEEIDMKAKIAAMARRLEELEMKKCKNASHLSTPLQAMPWAIFLSYEHLVEECPTIPVVREMFATSIEPAQAPQQASSLEQAMVNLNKIVGDVLELKKPSMLKSIKELIEWRFDNLQDSISRFANLNTMQEKENSPSQPYQNSMSIHEMEAQEENLQW